jgi:transposase
MGAGGRLGACLQRPCGLSQQRVRDDRLYHRPRAPARCRGKKRGSKEECLGRSRGGLSTKIHATCDAQGRPTAIHLTPGQAPDLDGADALLPGLVATARTVVADKGYDADDRVIAKLEQAKVRIVIPSRRGALRPRRTDWSLYKLRHRIENFFAWLKQYRGIATRYDKRARTFLGAIHLAAALCWLK